MKRYHVYIMASISRRLYTGITGNLPLRVSQHKTGLGDGCTAKYKVTRLVYCEEYDDVFDAIRREKQIKSWRRDKKVVLIESQNPSWKDLSEGLL